MTTGTRAAVIRDTVTLYFRRRILVVLLLGFSSGLPLLLSFSTLSTWMREVGVDLTSIGLFSLVGLPATELEKVSRLVRYAQAGNTFVINTMDNSARSYTVRLAEGGAIDLTMTDPTFLEYTLQMTVANASSPKVFMTVEYL